MEYDFSGYATKNNLLCADGRTIRAGAFAKNNGQKVPLLWQHGHSDATNVLGHALLEVRDDGVYAYCKFNDTPQGRNGKLLVQHGDIVALSIFANGLVEEQKNVIHGNIRELSLVLSGANPGALIDNIVIQHGDSEDILPDEAIIYTGLEFEHSGMSTYENYPEEGVNVTRTIQHDAGEKTVKDVFDSMNEEQKNVVYFMIGEALEHSDDLDDDEDDDLDEDDDPDEDDEDDVVAHADSGEKTVKDVFDSMTEEQKNVVYFMIGEALSQGDEDDSDDAEEAPSTAKHSDNTADKQNKDNTLQHNTEGSIVHNVFENNGSGARGTTQSYTLSHSDMTGIISDAEKLGSLKAAVESYALAHGIDNIEVLFPDARAVTSTPEFLSRRVEWVAAVLRDTKHLPFTRVKSVIADLTADQARAKGYIKGNLKDEEYFEVSKRETLPQTIYKKQAIDRDDVLDITDFDVVAWLRAEMRLMLDEEIARAILVGDGRSNGDPDKIKTANVRPIATDHQLYQTTINVNLDDANSNYDEIVDAVTLQRRHLKGSGMPTFFTSELTLAKMLLAKDSLGRRLYPNVDDLKSALRVRDIIPVEVFDDDPSLVGIIVNLNDYAVGADKGGQVSMFDDFDIDYNKQKYLIETRISGALIKPKSALVIRKVAGAAVLVTPTAPAFVDNTVTVPTITGVTYKNKVSGATLVTGTPVELDADETLTVIAVPASASYYFAVEADDEWSFTGIA